MMEEEIIDVIAKVLGLPVSEISGDTEIGEPVEWDSLRNVQIFAELEKKYSVKITQDMLVDLEYVSDIIELIANLR